MNPTHIFIAFERCWYYKIRLNPHKCIFCSMSRRLLWFIVSKYLNMEDTFNVEAILKLHPPSLIMQLQIHRGKGRFIPNYVEMTKGFMWLLKKGISFMWDDQAQWYFDTLKKYLMLSPLLCPPAYSRDFLLYISMCESTIIIVLVQEDGPFLGHAINYLSKGLIGLDLRYSHI